MSVSVFVVRAVVDAVARSGVDLRAFVPLDWRHLEQTQIRIEFEQFAAMLSAAVTATADEALGLHFVEHVTEGALDLLAHMAAHAPTMRAAVDICSQYTPLAMDGLRLTGHDAADAFVIEYAFPRSTPVVDRVLADLAVAGIVRLSRSFHGPSVAPRKVTFEHERAPYDQELARFFGVSCRFRQATTSVTFDREIVDRPQLHQHPELSQLLRTEAQRRLDRLSAGTGPADRLRAYLLATPPSRIPAISTAAHELGMSERSLRRHLAADGTSYRDAVRSALEASAGHMLRDPARTIKETSAALGFAETAAFHRAFKRWTGMTPGAYRRSRGTR